MIMEEEEEEAVVALVGQVLRPEGVVAAQVAQVPVQVGRILHHQDQGAALVDLEEEVLIMRMMMGEEEGIVTVAQGQGQKSHGGLFLPRNLNLLIRALARTMVMYTHLT